MFTRFLLFIVHTLAAGGFEHVLQLTNLEQLDLPGFWEAFEDLPAQLVGAELRVKLCYLRSRLEEATGPLL